MIISSCLHAQLLTRQSKLELVAFVNLLTPSRIIAPLLNLYIYLTL